MLVSDEKGSIVSDMLEARYRYRHGTVGAIDRSRSTPLRYHRVKNRTLTLPAINGRGHTPCVGMYSRCCGAAPLSKDQGLVTPISLRLMKAMLPWYVCQVLEQDPCICGRRIVENVLFILPMLEIFMLIVLWLALWMSR